MDKELLRIIIIATGLVVIIAMLLWGYFRNLKASRDMSYFDDEINSHKSPSQHFSPQSYMDVDEELEFDIVPLGSARDDAAVHPKGHEKHGIEPDNRSKQADMEKVGFAKESKSASVAPVKQANVKTHLPALIQFNIAAKSEQGFNGADLATVFNMVGLEYGSMKIFERLDINRMVDFGVASMINPGVFPGTAEEMAHFYTPGITFFMQPRELPDPILIYDDLVRTIHLIAKELDGHKWDAERKPLTDFTISLIRKSLQAS